MKNWFTLILCIVFGTNTMAQIGWWSTFESQTLTKSDTFWNGADLTKSFKSGMATFKNNYDTAWKVWDGFGVSNMTDTKTAGYTNQYSVISGSGANYTDQYAVISQQATVVLDKQQVVKGCYVNNATYPALSMKNGDGFAKKFGGVDGNDKDYFKIIATGHVGSTTTSEVFYLADYRDDDNSKDYIITDWTHWNLERLGDADSIVFTLESSDTGQFGMNTPAFFCMDNFNADSLENTYRMTNLNFSYLTDVDSFENGSNNDGGFENNGAFFVNNYNKDWKSWTGWSLSSMTDTSTSDYTNQYSCIAGSGFSGNTYLTGYSSTEILFPYVEKPHFEELASREFWVGANNSTCGYLSMRDGNGFAKKFGGVSGDDKDYLVLKASATLYSGEKSDTLSYYLADFRNDDNTKDYIQKDWAYWDISEIIANSPVVRLDFWIEGSDTGQYGLNTPAYFCMDNIFPLIGSVPYKNKKQLRIYPNPTNNVLHVKVDDEIQQITIYDLTGMTMSIWKDTVGGVDVSNLKSGIYFVEVLTNQGRITKQFIKE